ncbi:hypothetical protein [Ammoniphilus sp. 3BR4]|uniref:hypothetical protein n=1 Tax=Ammoniphilus sp. 3BR4 TaxID=3158265 RepID=UPI003467CE62
MYYAALFVIILGLILFSTSHPTTTKGYWPKLLVIISGTLGILYVLSIVNSEMDRLPRHGKRFKGQHEN